MTFVGPKFQKPLHSSHQKFLNEKVLHQKDVKLALMFLACKIVLVPFVWNAGHLQTFHSFKNIRKCKGRFPGH